MRSHGTSAKGARSTVLPKGVWFARKRLSSGDVVRYGYWGRGPGSIALGREGSTEFFTNLANAKARETGDKTVRQLIHTYRAQVLPQLRDRTQADYRKWLDKIEGRFGVLSLKAMESDLISRHIIDWRDQTTKSPRQADYLIQVFSALLGWGVRQRLLRRNQALNIERRYSGDRRDKVWSHDQQAAFLASAPEHLKRAFVLAVETGQRQGDLLKLTWSAVKQNTVSLKQSKGRVDVAIPVSKVLREYLDHAPRSDSPMVLTQENGKAWANGGNGFRSAWSDAFRAAGITGVTFHDLRGTFATRRMADGWSAEDVALCTGHSLRDLRTLERYVDRKMVAERRAEVMAIRLAGDEARTDSANRFAN